METIHDPAEALADIRTMMARSSKFLSLSGLAGISAGITALIGAAAAYWELYASNSPDPTLFMLLDAIGVLFCAVACAVFFTRRMARNLGIPAWSNTTKYILDSLLVPLCAGGIFCLLLWNGGYALLIGGVTLLFYGVALINTSKFIAPEVRYFGFLEMVLGLFAIAAPANWLIFWAFGFGAAHIVYGSVVFAKYEK